MAFPVSNNLLANTLAEVQASAIRARDWVSGLRDQSEAGPTARVLYVTLLRNLHKEKQIWDAAATVPGIGAYAQEQYNDGTLDVAAEFTAMSTACADLMNWIATNLPTDAGSGATLLETITATGSSTYLTFSAAGAAGFRTEADAFLATIG